MSDYHLHLRPHSREDAHPELVELQVEEIEAYVDHAATVGVSELGFTEHLYRCVEAEPVLGRFWEGEREDLANHTESFVTADRVLSLENYVEVVETAKERGLPVRLGLEVDFFPETFDAVLEFLAPYPWDFLIGSVHWVGGWSIDSAPVAFEFDRRGVDLAWEQYFDLEAQLARSGKVDVLAHVDVCKKLGRRPEREPLDLYRRVVEAAAASGTAVEVSSQGLRYPAQEVYPSPVFLELFHRAGVGITLGSDGHRPEEAGWGYEHVVAAARQAGYTEHHRFDERKARLVDLPVI